MKERSSPKLIWFALGAFTLFALTTLWMPAPRSTAQEDKRQLNRDEPQQTNRVLDRRIALVIGNGAYTNAPPLKNPPNDARDMAATLKTLGFDVSSGINVNQRDMKRLIREFGQKLKGGGSGLFYYAGHGVQSKGKNYLIPIEADIQSEIEVEDAGVDVNLVLGYMDDAQNGLNILILDACRDNPFARSFRSASGGLAQVDAPTGTLIAYATAPGRVASDGTGQNGLYTAELLKQMRVSGLSVTDMFMRVRAEVMRQTSKKQVPWEASSLVGTFYFTLPAKDSTSTQTSGATKDATIDPVAVEREYWETIRNSKDAQDFESYLRIYPNGSYAHVARTKIKQIQTNANVKTDAKLGSRIDDNLTPNTDWQPVRGDGFSILMPKGSMSEARQSLYNGGRVNRTIYRTPIGQRPFFGVISASGINARASRPSDAEKLDSYVDAFRYWLPEAVFGKGQAAQLTLLRENSVNGNPGREYQVTVGGSSGTAKAYYVANRFYVAIALDVSGDEILAKQFFDSLVLR